METRGIAQIDVMGVVIQNGSLLRIVRDNSKTGIAAVNGGNGAGHEHFQVLVIAKLVCMNMSKGLSCKYVAVGLDNLVIRV